jgi:hypothetical protein
VYLPNRPVADIVARFVKGSTGLVDVAKFRAYDAEPEIGKAPSGKRVTLELPALGQNIPVSEYNQLRARNGNLGDASILAGIQQTTKIVVRAVSDAMERCEAPCCRPVWRPSPGSWPTTSVARAATR